MADICLPKRCFLLVDTFVVNLPRLANLTDCIAFGSPSITSLSFSGNIVDDAPLFHYFSSKKTSRTRFQQAGHN